MSAIEQRARELLADVLSHAGYDQATIAILNDATFAIHSSGQLPTTVALSAIAAALTPPEGFVLVPECHTPAMDDAGCMALFGSTGGKQSAQVWKCWDAMIAARPEVP